MKKICQTRKLKLINYNNFFFIFNTFISNNQKIKNKSWMF